MAEYEAYQVNTWETTADLSNAIYLGIRMTAQYRCALASNPGDANLIGVLVNRPPAQGGFCTIAWWGKCKMMAGGAVAAASFVTVNGSGRAAVATSGQYTLGRALEAATADGDIITVLLGAVPAKA